MNAVSYGELIERAKKERKEREDDTRADRRDQARDV